MSIRLTGSPTCDARRLVHLGLASNLELGVFRFGPGFLRMAALISPSFSQRDCPRAAHPPSFSQRVCPHAARLSKASHVPTRGPWSAGAAIHQARVVVSPDEDLVAPVHDLVLDDNHSMGDVCERRLSKLSITKLHDSANPRSSRSSYSLLTPFAVFVATVGDSPPPSAGLTTTSCVRSAEVAMRDWAYSHCRLIFDSHRGSASKLTFTVTSCALLTIADTRAAVV